MLKFDLWKFRAEEKCQILDYIFNFHFDIEYFVRKINFNELYLFYDIIFWENFHKNEKNNYNNDMESFSKLFYV